MAKGKILSELQREKICEMYKQNYTYSKIAAAVGCCVYSVNKVIHEENIIQQYARRATPSRKITAQIRDNRREYDVKQAEKIESVKDDAAKRAQALRLATIGYSAKDIGNFVGMSEQKVELLLNNRPSCKSDSAISVAEYLKACAKKLLDKKEYRAAMYIANALEALYDGEKLW